MAFHSPLVSVCIPIYNAGNYLSKCIDSILDQSYSNIEIILVNDGSTDNTAELLQQYIHHNKIVVIHQENKGQCTAANAAFKASKGALIKFMDADDIISKDFIKKQVARLNGRTDAVASASWGRFYNDDLSTFQLNPEKVWRDIKPIDWLVDSLWEGPNMMQCALWLIPRKVLHQSGLWDERLSLINDFDFFIRVLLVSNDVFFTEEAVLYYRSGIKSSLSAQKSRKAYESAYLSTKLGVESILAFENSGRTRKVCSDLFQLWKYEFYPQHMDLYKLCEAHIKNLGGSKYPFPAGGKTKLLSQIVGWKMAKHISRLT